MNRLVVSVSVYNNDAEVIEYGRQLSSQTYSANIVYLVTANSSNNYEKLESNLNELHLETHIYHPAYNLGYLNGCIFGIKQFNDLNEDDCVVISNTDLDLIDSTLFRSISAIMDETSIWCLGPSIMLKNGRLQNPFLVYRPNSYTMKKLEIIQGNPILLSIYSLLSTIKHRIVDVNEVEESNYVYAVHGSFFVLNYACVNALIESNNDIFMYGEEILIAEIVRSKGGHVKYVGDLMVIHNENSTTGLTNAAMKAKWYKQSFKYLNDTYFMQR